MKKLRAALAAAIEKLGLIRAAIGVARKRYHAAVRRADRHGANALEAQAAADEFRAAGDLTGAVIQDQKARRRLHRKYAAELNAQARVAQIKRLIARRDGTITTIKEKRAAIAKLKKDRGVKISGDTVTGGSPRDRLLACQLASAAACAAGTRPNFYSQLGAWDVDRCISGERWGERSDCSSWVTSVYKSCGLDDPNGASFTGGYTGTLVTHGKAVSEADAQPGDLVIYGPSYATHHVEMVRDPAERSTTGHGSSPVDEGTFNLFGDSDYQIRSYV